MARRGGTPENLKPFKKGQSGNPKGREPVLPELKAAMAKMFSKEKNGINALEMALTKLIEQAEEGNLKAIEILLDRGYGKPHQSTSTELTGELTQKTIVFRDATDADRRK